MQAVPSPGVSIDHEDFRRLGVRPQETRLNVIRMAATRSTKSLAEKHLRSRDDSDAVQLSRVATSAYRLMDPRFREDEYSRIRIGRILPSTLIWAGRTRFADSSSHTTLDSAFHQQPLSDQELVELLDLDGTARFDDEVQGWTPRIEHKNRRLSFSNRSALQRLRSLLTSPTAACIALCILGALFGFLIVLSRSDRMIAPTKNVTAIALRSDWEHDKFDVRPLLFVSAVPLEETSWLDRHTLLMPTLSDLAGIPALDSLVVETPQPPDSIPRSGFARPDGHQRRLAIELLEQKLPELRRLSLPSQVSSQIQSLQDVSQQAEWGSAEHWVLQMYIAELEWLSGSTAVVDRRLDELSKRYGESKPSLIAETFASACARATLPETHLNLLATGTPLADRLLIQQRFDESRRVVTSLRPSADALEHDQAISELNTLFDAIDQAEKLSEVAARIGVIATDHASQEQDASASTASELGVLGRYHCFYLRQWEIGLPWLSKAADGRIAGAARRELELGPAAEPAESLKVAMLWLAMADRSSGRIADSIRLHGIEMLERSLPRTNGLQRLRLQRAIDQHSQKLPAYLRRSLATS